MIARASTLLAFILTVGALASAARAEVPSVDAYGGEALVLGHPHKQVSGGAGNQGRRSRESDGTEGDSSNSPAGAGGSNGGGSNGGGPAGGSSHGGAGTSSGRGAASGSSSGRPGAGSSAANGGSQATGGVQPAATTSEGTFSTGDLLLILFGAACIAGIGVTLRVSRRPA
ncbi:MAG: hypothetical protein ACRDK4_13820 [Solirubrobacteraceae bacterium]